ncbi:rCG24170, isoform CRA_a [Rattus norvegicus]|uniref:RCG24170, isoform CRA_a n=1 Tax=Rattus norvegicus TaxID=10116 RepID=A6KAH2_RAT|nr:rCG24170, isoform CRA_a [Rattus norvegicus]EDL93880.1 rCG24170, isoform CRA_a [Rattus norvegicus]
MIDSLGPKALRSEPGQSSMRESGKGLFPNQAFQFQPCQRTPKAENAGFTEPETRDQ